jgi:hypothetical protein
LDLDWMCSFGEWANHVLGNLLKDSLVWSPNVW